MEHTIESALKRRAALVGGKAWGADKGKPRVYMDYGRKDVSAYIAFPNAVTAPSDKAWDQEPGLGLPELKVYIDEPTEPVKGNWFTEMKAKVRSAYRMKVLAIMALDHGAEELSAALSVAPDVDDTLYDQVAGLLADGKVAEATAAITAGEGEAPF